MLRVNYNNVQYGMGGPKVGFIYSDDKYIEVFKELSESLKDRLTIFYDHYEVDKVDSIQLLVVRIKDRPE